MCFTPDTPPPRDYAAETAGNLRAQIDNAPDLFAARSSEQYGDPAYTELTLRNLNRAAFGSQSTPGLLEIYRRAQPQLSAFEAADRDYGRSADIAAISRLGPQAREAVRGSNPDAAALVDMLSRQASVDLSAGGALSPDQERAARQAVRADYANRGLAVGDPAVFGEALNVELARRGEVDRRQLAAQRAVLLNQAVYGDPFQQILGRPSTAVSSAAGFAGQAAGGVTRNDQLDPNSGYASDIFNTNYNAEAAANIAGANNRASVIAAGAGSL